MTLSRSPTKSKELHEAIKDMWLFRGMSVEAITNEINANRKDLGSVTKDGVYYHIVQIRQELEETISEDALDVYVAEWLRLREALDKEIEDADRLVKLLSQDEIKNAETIIRLKRLKKDLYLDKMKMLQDGELPLQVKKLKRERKAKSYEKAKEI